MTLEEQLKDLQEKLDMTQAIKHGGELFSLFNRLDFSLTSKSHM